MANGYFQTDSNEDKKLYCEWHTEADYETNTSRIIVSVFIKYKPPLEIKNGEVVVNIGDKSERFPAISFIDNSSETNYYTRLLYSGELQKVKHKSSNPEKILLSVSLFKNNAEETAASGEILLDPIPQVYPVLTSKHVTRISQNSAQLTMQTSHPQDIKEYVLSIRGVQTQRSSVGEAVFSGLKPDTYYVAEFQMVTSVGFTSPAEIEIFKTEPVYIGDIAYSGSVPIELYENEAVPLRLQIIYRDNALKVLQFIGGKQTDADEKSEVESNKLQFSSSNSRIASVSKDGVIQGVSKGTCKIEISASDGGIAKTSVTVNVLRSIEYVHITNPKIQIQKSADTGDENKKYRVSYSVYPDGANKEKLSFESSNKEIIEVGADGTFTVKGLGHATIKLVKSDKNEIMGTCTVDVVKAENGSSVWQDLNILPIGARWDYQIPDAINENLHYIQKALNSENAVELEDASFPDGFNTNIREICYKLNALERNIDKINEEIPWVTPYYKEHREYGEYAPMREDINRWIEFCTDIKSVIDGVQGKLMILSIDGEPLVISDNKNESIQYLCLREE